MKRIRLEVESGGSAKFYCVESEDPNLEEFMREKGRLVFADPVLQRVHMEPWELPPGVERVVERSFLPGVTDNPGRSAQEGLRLAGITARVSSGELFFDLPGSGGNPLIHRLLEYTPEEFARGDRFARVELPGVELSASARVEECPLDGDLQALSRERCLALNLAELTHLQNHYLKLAGERKELGLPPWPTDVELEIVAQTWSEHCKHKIFSARIDYEGRTIEGLYPTYIKGVTREIEKERSLDWLMSVFSDNAGIVRFDSKVDFCIKVETHNSPSALDPYGGALTGILGVNRDILGAGLGARPIANTDVFCLGPPEWPDTPEREKRMPAGLMNPGQLLAGVHKGVQDGGNKSGIPTVGGAMVFDPDYSGKPLIFCGTVGVLPRYAGKRTAHEKHARPGDRIVMAGGAIGADGIHGATFSSMELNESSPTTAVQIGDPLTQKRLADFLLEARDLGLYSAVTDNGAGGLSSSVGEMALLTGGARLDLSAAPVKYPGLAPWELMISESQERMTLAVPPGDWPRLRDLAERRGVRVSDLGEFNTCGRLEVFYEREPVASLDLHFLHHSLPPMELRATRPVSRERKAWWGESARLREEGAWGGDILAQLLARPNIVSKEHWVSQYDQQVQGASRLRPFVGEELSSPSDAAVLWAAPHGGEEGNALALGQGLAPRLSLHDPFLMAQWAVDEAIRNVVAAGGLVDQLCLLDNFCWPDPVASAENPQGEEKLGSLVRACQGLAAICKAYGTPLVSGKDSMKNDFRGRDRGGDPLTISILPTLLVTTLARASMDSIRSAEFKEPGDGIYLLWEPGRGLLASEYAELALVGDSPLPGIDPAANLQLYRDLGRANFLRSCHDISEGGLLVAVAESCFARHLGADLTWRPEGVPLPEIFFNEAPGRFIVTVKPEDRARLESLFSGRATFIGEVNGTKRLKAAGGLQAEVETLFRAWEGQW